MAYIAKFQNFNKNTKKKITKTQYSQYKTQKKWHICVHTPKPKLDIVLNVEKLKYMDKEFMIWKSGHFS